MLHVLTVALLVAVGLGLPVGVFYWLGVAAVAALLVYEHSLVRPGDLRRLDAAFFTMNGVISVVLAFVLALAWTVRCQTSKPVDRLRQDAAVARF